MQVKLLLLTSCASLRPLILLLLQSSSLGSTTSRSSGVGPGGRSATARRHLGRTRCACVYGPFTAQHGTGSATHCCNAFGSSNPLPVGSLSKCRPLFLACICMYFDTQAGVIVAGGSPPEVSSSPPACRASSSTTQASATNHPSRT